MPEISERTQNNWYKKFNEDAKSMVLVLMSIFILGESTFIVYLINQNNGRLDALLKEKLEPAIKEEVKQQVQPLKDNINERLENVDTIAKSLKEATQNLKN